MCLLLLSKSVITGPEFFSTFRDVFNDSPIHVNYSLLEQVMSTLKKTRFQKSIERLNLDHFELGENPNFWELIAGANLLLFLLEIYPDQKQEVIHLIRISITLLAKRETLDHQELILVIRTFEEIIESFPEDFEESFEDIWTIISREVFCLVNQGCPENFHKITHDVFNETFKLISIMFRVFPKHRASIFINLEKLIFALENPVSCITSSRQSKSKSKDLQDCLRQSGKTLKSLVLSKFSQEISKNLSPDNQANAARIIEGGHLSEDLGVSCGLTNLSSTCYFNSLIQQFSNMEWFIEFVLNNCAEIGRKEIVESITDGGSIIFVNFRQPDQGIYQGIRSACVLVVYE